MDIGLDLLGLPTLWAAVPEWLQNTSQIAWNVVLVVVGINALIIVHEFGHFIVARMCGVRCDKFYIWFDIYGWRLFRFTWGGTEYGLGVLPLGGYVKMFGQEDNPGQIAKELEAARTAAVEKTQTESVSTGDDPVQSAENAENKEIEEDTESKEKEDDAEDKENAGVENDSPRPVATGAISASGSTAFTGEEIITGEEIKRMETALYAKDSYLAKSVPQRMAIISAGVVMNLIFAFVCATGAYLIGFQEVPCAVGTVTPGSPAWKAGLRTGDRIVKADGKKDIVKFDDLRDAIFDSTDPNGVTLTIQRPGLSEPIQTTIIPSKVKGSLVPTIGILNAATTRLNEKKDSVLEKSVQAQLSRETLEKLRENAGRDVVALNGERVEDYADIVRIQETCFDVPLDYTFRKIRPESPKSGSFAAGTESSGEPAENAGVGAVDSGNAESRDRQTTVTIAPIAMKEIGVYFEIGPIVAVKQGSEAEALGIVAGDLLVDVDNLGTFDPLQLPQYLRKKAGRGAGSVNVAVRKKTGEQIVPATETTPETIVPLYGEKRYFDMILDPVVQSSVIASPQDVVACSPLGISYSVTNRVARIDPRLEHSGKTIPVGAVVEKVEFPSFCPPRFSRSSFIEIIRPWYFFGKIGFRFTHVGQRVQIPFIHDGTLQIAPEGTKVLLHASHETRGGEIVEDTYEFVVRNSSERFSNDRGLVFETEKYSSKSESFLEATQKGFAKTVEGTLKVYQFLRNIGGKIDPRAMGGPGTIVYVAYAYTNEGIAPFLLFLCLIGANLAVLNVLPIPVLDGGHLVFLLYEAVFRKPPNESIQIVLSYLGLLLILALMVWAISLDIGIVSRF